MKLSEILNWNEHVFGIFDLFVSRHALHCCFTQSFLLFDAKPAVCRRVLYIYTLLFTLSNETTTRAYRTETCDYYTADGDLEEKFYTFAWVNKYTNFKSLFFADDSQGQFYVAQL